MNVKKSNMTDAERAFTHHVMFSEGIVPMEDPTMDVRKALETLPLDEARKMKRKFRKLWRKYLRMQEAKKTGALAPSRYRDKTTLGKGAKSPSRHNKLVRKQMVLDTLRHNVIVPAVVAFNKIKSETNVSPQQAPAKEDDGNSST